MDLLSLVGRGGLARTDGPYGLVGDHEVLELLLGEVVNDLLDLGLHYVEVLAGLALLEVLTHAVDRRKVVGIGLLHLLVERSGGLAVVLAALRVAEDYIFATQGGDHRGCDLSRVGTLGLGGAVLGTQLDVRTLQGLGDHCQVGERRADDEVHARAYLAASGYDALCQFDSFGRKHIHLPVAGNDFLSHFRSVFYLC